MFVSSHDQFVDVITHDGFKNLDDGEAGEACWSAYGS